MKKKTEARVTGSTLTAGFHSAQSPLIWRFDLQRNHSFTFSLQGDDGDWELGVTSEKGDFSSIAHFDEREDAEEALAAVEKALSRKSTGGLVLKALGLVGLLAASTALVVFLFATFLMHPRHQARAFATGAATPPVAVHEEDGVPMSADDILQPPR